ncbi:hypothetical protein Ciccas_012474, partial [Cichlidogyrus casuarinus]
CIGFIDRGEDVQLAPNSDESMPSKSRYLRFMQIRRNRINRQTLNFGRDASSPKTLLSLPHPRMLTGSPFASDWINGSAGHIQLKKRKFSTNNHIHQSEIFDHTDTN